jgi:hypothetical protein
MHLGVPDCVINTFHLGELHVAPEEHKIYWSARNLANLAIWGVIIQIERVKQYEPVDENYSNKNLVDFQFLIVALWRLRRAAKLALSATNSTLIASALAEFDRALPDLKDMRDAAEHRDEYEAGKGQKARIRNQALSIHIQDKPNEWRWSGFNLNFEKAMQRSEELFAALIESEPPKGEIGPQPPLADS